jgi:hypothetical protein
MIKVDLPLTVLKLLNFFISEQDFILPDWHAFFFIVKRNHGGPAFLVHNERCMMETNHSYVAGGSKHRGCHV